ncbi:MAG: nuclear transport factor 2 family protein [Novosphingobium sp.]|nr:nuclear transport factor 2 family protein [Novosphingobium sp.]
MDDLKWLVDLEKIKRLKAKCFRCVDTQDMAGFGSCFTEDARLEFDFAPPADGSEKLESLVLDGRDALVEFWGTTFSTARSVHHGHMPEIDILSDTEASGIWAMEDIIEYPDSTIQGYGHYHETYRMVGDEWLISSLHLTRLRMEQQVRGKMFL